VRDLAARFVKSRVDVSAGTQQTYDVNLGRILPALGSHIAADLTPADVAEFATSLKLARESARKTISTLAQVLDFGDVHPNPARSKRVKLSGERAEEVHPPTAAHVIAVFGALPSAYRLPLLVLDATGMRVGELESLRWGDVDEPERRWRVSKARTKTRQGRWVPVPENVFQAVLDTVPREDRDLEAQVFAGFANTRFRTSLARACKATGTPLFSPHDLRHRRATLWHLSGMPAAEAAGKLGHSPTEHLRTYAHVVLDRTELDYSALISDMSETGNDHAVHTPVHTSM
jgi:integrase